MIILVTLSFCAAAGYFQAYINVLIPEVILRSYMIFKQRSFYKTLTTVAQLMILDIQNIYDT